MNTSAHAVVNLLILRRKNRPKHNLPILIGSVFSVYLSYPGLCLLDVGVSGPVQSAASL